MLFGVVDLYICIADIISTAVKCSLLVNRFSLYWLSSLEILKELCLFIFLADNPSVVTTTDLYSVTG